MIKWLLYPILGVAAFAGATAITWQVYLHFVTGDPLQGRSPSYLVNHPALVAKERRWCATRPMAVRYQRKNCLLADHVATKSGR